ncbi:MAG TPA: zinc finger domain-containing protein [Candidatus Nanoarchaeia archaeon]|nr:zinc finger domain-containing protein [Candidatus Nanoarchaeia archaeon]
MDQALIQECISCKKNIANDRGTTHFACPKCGEYEVIRCFTCREIVAKYKCPKCQFEGPN